MKNLCGLVIALISSPLVELATAAVELFPFVGKTQAAHPNERRIREQLASPRIINGVDAPKGRYPYAVSLQDSGRHKCGGSLIAPDIVLSAAHCYGALHVLINGHTLSTPSSNSETFNVITEVAHPQFRTWKYTNDILLLKLDANSSAPVVRINQNPTSPADNEIVRVIGWGASSADGVAAHNSSVSDVLQVVDVIYVNNDVCEVALQRQISDDMCCTIDAGQGSCQGDSGGPLIIPGDDASDDNQVGIVSWGTGCAETNFPGVYSRISHNYEHFIRSFTCILSTNPPDWFDCENASTYSPAPSPGPKLPSATSSENDTSSTPSVEATNGVVELSDAWVPNSTESPQSPFAWVPNSTESPQSPFTPSPPNSILSNGAPIISAASPFISSTAKHDYLVTGSLLFFGLINHILSE